VRPIPGHIELESINHQKTHDLVSMDNVSVSMDDFNRKHHSLALLLQLTMYLTPDVATSLA
jgi:hypothetical protein